MIISDENANTGETPASTKRRGHWLRELRQTRPSMHKKFWQQTKADLLREMETCLQEATIEGRDLKEGEERWYAQAKTDLEFVNGNLKALCDQEDETFRQRGEQVFPRDQWGGRIFPRGIGGDRLLPENARARLVMLQQTAGPQGRRYADLFQDAGDLGGFQSADEFLTIVASGMADERILRINAASHIEGIPSQGGVRRSQRFSQPVVGCVAGS